MAKKDFDEYVLKITKQYKDFKDVLAEVSKEAQQGLTDIDYIDNLEKQILPLKENYERIMYIKFLLDQPTRKDKIKNYKKRLQKSLVNLNTNNNTDNILKENEDIINKIKENKC